jgi:hypothetical protein
MAQSIRRSARQLWDGALPLAVTYWVWGVGGNVIFALLLRRAYVAARQGRARPMWPWLIYSLSLAWFGLIFRAIWRSAGSYRGPKIWGALARLGVLAGALRMTAEAGVLLAFDEITSGRKVDEGGSGRELSQ